MIALRALPRDILLARPWALLGILLVVSTAVSQISHAVGSPEIPFRFSDGLTVAACAVVVCAAVIQIRFEQTRRQLFDLEGRFANLRDQVGAISRHAPVGLMVTDPNGDGGTTMGKHLHDARGRTVGEVFGPQVQMMLTEDRCTQGLTQAVDVHVGARTFHLVLEPLRSPAGRAKGWNVVAIESTARHSAEREVTRLRAELRRREDQDRRLRETSALGVAVYDGQGRLVEVNKAFTRMFGYNPDDLIGMTAEDLTHPDDIGRTMEMMLRLRSGGADTGRMTKRYVRKSGDEFDADVDLQVERDRMGEVLRVIVRLEDRSIAERSNRARVRTERALAHVMALSRDGVIVLDESGRVAAVNSRFAELIGADTAQIAGSRGSEILGDVLGRRRRSPEDVERLLTTEAGVVELDCSHEDRQLILASSPLCDEAGTSLGRCVTMR